MGKDGSKSWGRMEVRVVLSAFIVEKSVDKTTSKGKKYKVS